MQTKTWMLFIGILLAVFLSYEAFASEHLIVESDTETTFSGNYSAGKDLVVFESALEDSKSVKFKININGTERLAYFSLNGKAFADQDYEALSDAEQDLMFDAMNAVASYYQDNPKDVEMPGLILVGAMGYLSHR